MASISSVIVEIRFEFNQIWEEEKNLLHNTIKTMTACEMLRHPNVLALSFTLHTSECVECSGGIRRGTFAAFY